MSTQATTNGTAGAEALAHIVEELEAQAAPLTARRHQIQAELKDLEDREMRIREAITVLRGPVRRTLPPVGGKRSKHDWKPSQKVLDDTYAAILAAGEAITLTEISNVTHSSRGTAQKAIEELRRQERIRFIGHAGRGNAARYAVMPSE